MLGPMLLRAAILGWAFLGGASSDAAPSPPALRLGFADAAASKLPRARADYPKQHPSQPLHSPRAPEQLAQLSTYSFNTDPVNTGKVNPEKAKPDQGIQTRSKADDTERRPAQATRSKQAQIVDLPAADPSSAATANFAAPTIGPWSDTPRFPSSSQDWRRTHLRVLPPESRGIGFMVAAGSATSIALIKQLYCVYRNADPGCRQARIADRLLLLGGVAALAWGSKQRAHHHAYHDAITQRLKAPKRSRRIWFGILTGLGAAGFLTDVVLQAACMLDGGPYFIDKKTPDQGSPYYYGCRGWVGTVVMDVSAIALGTGAAFLTYDNVYSTDRKIFERGKIFIVPGARGLSLQGQF